MSRHTTYLRDILPDIDISFSQRGENPFWKHEQKVLTPALLALGYRKTESNEDWFTTEGDSFGPLSRGIPMINPEGVRTVVWYG